METQRRGHVRWFIAPVLLLLLLLVGNGVVLAAGGVQDDGQMFSASGRQQANAKIQQIQQNTGKTIDVVTVAALKGKDISAEADKVFQQQRLNGVLIYISKADRTLALKVGAATRQVISTQEEASIRDTITASFRKNDFDGGLLAGIDRLGGDLGAAKAASGNSGAAAPAGAARPAPVQAPAGSRGFNWTPILLLVGGGLLVLWVVRNIRNQRARDQQMMMNQPNVGPIPGNQSMYGGGYNVQPPMQGYGGGGWFGGGGGGFGRGIAGGIAGAFLGNAAYDWFRDRNQSGYGQGGYNQGPYANDPGSAYAAPSEPGWTANDAGQVADSPQDVGSWGDSSGGSDSGSSVWGSGDSGSSGDNSGGDSGTSSW